MRKTTRSFVTLIVLFILLATLTGSAFAAPPVAKAKWTVMVYISGDNNLEEKILNWNSRLLAPARMCRWWRSLIAAPATIQATVTGKPQSYSMLRKG